MPVLRALSREHEGELALAGQRLLDEVYAAHVFDLAALLVLKGPGRVRELLSQLPRRARDDGQPQPPGFQRSVQRVSHVEEPGVGNGLEVPIEALTLGQKLPSSLPRRMTTSASQATR